MKYNTNNLSELGTRMKAIREKKNLKRTKFAWEIGVVPETYTNYEEGKSSVQLEHLIAFCNKCEVSIYNLLFDDFPVSKNKIEYSELDLKKIGETLKQLEEKEDYKKKKIAKELNCDEKTYRRLKEGEGRFIVEYLLKFANLYHVSIWYILYEISFPKDLEEIKEKCPDYIECEIESVDKQYSGYNTENFPFFGSEAY